MTAFFFFLGGGRAGGGGCAMFPDFQILNINSILSAVLGTCIWAKWMILTPSDTDVNPRQCRCPCGCVCGYVVSILRARLKQINK
jgi:hypothetical protein